MSTASGLPVVDLDGHVFEPDSLWEEHLDPAYLDRRPRLIQDDRGTSRYLLDGRAIPPGTGRGAWVPEGIREASAQRDGATDPKARLVDMDAEGIDVAVLYGAVSLGFYALEDADLAVACCRAYNDWLAGYCAVAPERLMAAPALPLQSFPDALDEARRVVTELGFVSLTVSCSVGEHNPDSEAYEPMYALAEELDVPLGFHAGGPRFAYHRFVDDYPTLHVLEFPYDIMFAAATIVGGGVLDRFPKLRLALLEAGSAWGPFLFERLDEHWEKRAGEMRCRRPPSDYLGEGRLVVTCEAERWLPHSIEGLGVQTVAYASDYPHWDCEFPESVRKIAERDDVTETDKAAILSGNATRILGLNGIGERGGQ